MTCPICLLIECFVSDGAIDRAIDRATKQYFFSFVFSLVFRKTICIQHEYRVYTRYSYSALPLVSVMRICSYVLRVLHTTGIDSFAAVRTSIIHLVPGASLAVFFMFVSQIPNVDYIPDHRRSRRRSTADRPFARSVALAPPP